MRWRLAASVFVVSLALNTVWEMAQMPAGAALVDAASTLAVWGLARRIVRSPPRPEWRLALVMAPMGALGGGARSGPSGLK